MLKPLKLKIIKLNYDKVQDEAQTLDKLKIKKSEIPAVIMLILPQEFKL